MQIKQTVIDKLKADTKNEAGETTFSTQTTTTVCSMVGLKCNINQYNMPHKAKYISMITKMMWDYPVQFRKKKPSKRQDIY